MTQPKLPPELRRQLHQMGLVASLYQPVTMFVKNGRKLPNVAEPGDPWECFLRREGDVGIASRSTGWTAEDAVERAFTAMLGTRGGVLGAMASLGEAVDLLTETINAG